MVFSLVALGREDIFLATRLPCSGGWRGVGYEVTTLKVHVAS
ncbi:hypothetical protein HMPREF3193_00709 [Bifidobacterium breve]|nr:hypothetical protein HMPREF1587_01802 [Bifidobacterium breve JCP7499]KWZ85902.1 hypothetical protein HMPREF3193_00709 [Bifidobacterium breve]